MKNLRRKNKRRPKPLLESDKKDAGVTKLTSRDDNELDWLRRRAMYASVVLIFFFAVIVSRLWYLQVQQGDKYRDLADSNRVRYLEVAAPRGNILDRFGREIVTNRPSFNVVWIREDNKINDEWLKKITNALDVEPGEILEKIRKMAHEPGHLPVRLAEDINWETVAHIENNRMNLPGIKIEVVPLRVYHYGNLASHLIGYLGEINKKELESAEPSLYRGGDLVGKMGLERLREKDLRGEKGRNYMEVNALGFEQRNLKGLEPLPGNDLRLTLDMELQKTAEDLMAVEDYAGAVVALEANSGRMLVLASAPALHLDEFVGGISHKAWKGMLENPHHPLVNKLVQGQYPPGSTFKAITAVAGLAEGVITPESVIYCPGHYRFGNRTYRCWKRGGHGAVNLKRALSESCDVYFYQVGQRLGVDRIAKYAKLFGLGKKTGIEMEHEKAGIVPTIAWKKKRYGKSWQEGETLSVAIGQGFDLVTPVQLALMTAALANGGTLYKPAIVEEVKDPDGHVIESFRPQILERLAGQGRTLKLVRDGLVEAVNGKRGTGKKASLKDMGIMVGGKTGTAQVVRLKQYMHLREEDIPYKYRDHALFISFAPAENPEIVVAVVVEHGLHGGSAAAPIAGAVLRKYFEIHPRETEVSAVVLFDELLVDASNSKADTNGNLKHEQTVMEN
ncbi:penicillin-binding protein 2 [Desulfogranum japonicum]|uniref:penicillin-binding protein 2 n=1 Tax=Desulfogranum japonicum TaxID=231447 RepID=UPI0004197279|nr:penicillin-binding protein 2 [Desulfogranum japonicum]